MSESRIVESLAFMVGYFFVSIIMAMLNGYPLSIWLGINVALAIIPFVIISFVWMKYKQAEYKTEWWMWVLMAAFIFFLPNTFYIITDMIHIDQADFYTSIEYGTVEYLSAIEPYILIFHI